MKTYTAKPADIKRDWVVVDAEGQVLGRLATMIAMRLRGKHKPTFTPHMDTGDFVIVVNADKVKLTGNKLAQKNYHHYSGYMGGMKETTYEKMPADISPHGQCVSNNVVLSSLSMKGELNVSKDS